MSYESAPATKLLASHCACCGRPLVDSKSVEAGVGPECRKKHGYGEAQLPANWEKVTAALGAVNPPVQLVKAIFMHEAHKAANILVYHIAAQQEGGYVANFVEALGALGYTNLARRMVQRLNGIIVDLKDSTLIVRAPYNPALQIGSVAGASYSHTKGVRFTAPAEQARGVWTALCAGYKPGTLVAGAKGVRRTNSKNKG